MKTLQPTTEVYVPLISMAHSVLPAPRRLEDADARFNRDSISIRYLSFRVRLEFYAILDMVLMTR